MGLFENATPYEKIIDEKKKNPKSSLKYLHQGVFPMTFQEAELSESKGGNLALVMKYDTGFVAGGGEPTFIFKHYYLIDKATLTTFHRGSVEEGAPDPRRILDSSFLGVREMLFTLFGIKIETVSSITESREIGKLKGMARQITLQLQKRNPEERKVAATVDYPRSPSPNERYYLEIEWLNPIGELASRQASFKPKANPNPIQEREQTAAPLQSSLRQEAPDDLSF
ncbi:hypothetical protein [Rufibacter roseolus]|uniref:hypothetical protein n=1 Tax=Rufibacter roseolus TaxID=2817375 RepID=UPI001B30134E|nr:hypothetical protein [Rufibacter roseolus]